MLWEAQFGDFVNGAQIIIDQYLVAAEDKWGQTSGLVLLLPHGYEGQGPEHSLGPHRAVPHARAPRTTSRSCNATTAAQYFHLLRRQMRRDGAQAADRVHAEVAAAGQGVAARRSTTLTAGLVPGGARRPARHRSAPRCSRVVFCSGKVGLRRHRRARRARARPVAVVARRAALPVAVRAAAPRCSAATRTPSEVVWLQEEPENMGPWQLHQGPPLRGSTTAATRSTASAASSRAARPPARHAIHAQEQTELLDDAASPACSV